MLLFSRKKCLVILSGLSFLVVSPAWADKPEWAGNGKPDKHEKQERHERQHEQKHEMRGSHFTDHHRSVAVNYYGKRYGGGKKCPPGLAKKHNGCMPPGQARQWQLHQPLPPGVHYYSVPRSVVVGMGPPPQGYRYVRVGADILMIAVGTQMVVDAITDIVR